MATIDYEKKYKEALEKARQLCAYPTTKPFISDLQDLFPELKESEDKKMIQYFKDLAPFDKADELYEKYGFSHKDAIAWLEKQVEQKSIGFNIGDEITVNGQVCRVVAVDSTVWSKEDKSIRQLIINAIWIYYRDCVDDKSGRDRLLNWLNSLRSRVQPQQEWSEEDDQYLLVCKNALTKYQTTDKWDAEIISHWLENKLKVHQSTWKPSGEQVVALDGICSYIRNKADWEISQDTIYELYSLSEQLKKLRDEK